MHLLGILLIFIFPFLLFCSISGSVSLLSGTAHQGCSDCLFMTNHTMTPVELCCFKISWVTVCYEYIPTPMSCEQMCSHSLSWAICCFIFVPGLISVRLSSLPDKMCFLFFFFLHSLGTRFSKNLRSFFDTYGSNPDLLELLLLPTAAESPWMR